MIVGEGADVGITRAAEVIEDEPRQGVVAEQVQVGGAVEGDDVRRGDLAGEDVGLRALVDGRAVEDQAVGRGRDDHARGGSEQVNRAAVDHRAAAIAGGGVGQVDGAARSGQHEAYERSGGIVHHAGIQRQGVRAIEEIQIAGPRGSRATGGQATGVDAGADGVTVIGADETAADEVQDVVDVRELQVLRSPSQAQGVQGGRAGLDGRGRGQPDVGVRIRSRQQRRAGVRRAVRAQGEEAAGRGVGQEVRAIDGPAADDVVDEAGATVEGGRERAGVAGAGAAQGGVRLDDQGRRRTHGTRERGHAEVLREDGAVAAVVHVEDVEAGDGRDRADVLHRGHVGPSPDIERTGTQRHGSGVADAVTEIIHPGGVRGGGAAVVEDEGAVGDLERLRAAQGAEGEQHGVGGVEDRRAGEREIAVQRQRVLAGTDEGGVALDATGPEAGVVVMVDDQGRAGRVGIDDGAGRAGHVVVAQQGQDLLGPAVEVERTRGEGQEIVRLDGVVGEEAHRAVVDHHLAAVGVGALRGQPVDRGERGPEREHAAAGLDQADVAVRDAVAAVKGRDEVEVAERPEIERRQVRHLVDHAAGEGRKRGTGADEHATALQEESSPWREGQGGTRLDGQGIGRDEGLARERAASGQEPVMVGERDEVPRGRDEGIFVFVRLAGADAVLGVDALVQGAGIAGSAVGGGEGSPGAALARIDQRPRHHAFVRSIDAAALPVPSDDAVPAQRSETRADAQVRAPDQQARARRSPLLGRGDVVGDRIMELEPGGTQQAGRADGDDRAAATESDVIEELARIARRVGAVEREITAAEMEVIGGAGVEDVVAAAIEGVEGGGETPDAGEQAVLMVDDHRGARLEEEVAAPAARTGQTDRALTEDEGTAVDAAVEGDVLGVGDGQRARAEFLDGVEAAVRRTAFGGDLRAGEDDVPRAGEVELALLGDLADAARQGEHAGGGTDGRVDRHGDNPRVGVVAGEILERSAEIDAAEQLVRGAGVERIEDGDAARQLHRGAERRRRKVDGFAARAGRLGMAEPQDAVAHGGVAGVDVGAREGEHAVAGLGEAEGAADLGDRARQHERLRVIDRSRGGQEDRTADTAAGQRAAQDARAADAAATEPDDLRDDALEVEGRDVRGQREHLAGGAEGVGVAERQGAAGDVDVAREAKVGVAHREHAARATIEDDVAAAGQLAGVVEPQRGVGTDRDRAAGGADLEEIRVGVRIEDARAQLERAAVEDDLARRAGHAGAQGAGRGLGAIVGRAADGKRAAVDVKVAGEGVGAGQDQGAEARLGEAAGRGAGDGRADGQRVAGRVDADDEVSRGTRGQADRAADRRGGAAGDQHARRGDERVGGEAEGGETVEEQARDSHSG